MKVWIVYFVLPVGLVFIVICAIAASMSAPCRSFWTGAITGPQTYDGQRIECFKGDVVSLRRTSIGETNG